MTLLPLVKGCLGLIMEVWKCSQKRAVPPENPQLLQNPRDPRRRHQPVPAKGLYSCCGRGDCKVTVGRFPQLYSLLYTRDTLTQNLCHKGKQNTAKR